MVTTKGRLTESVWEESKAVALADAGDAEGLLGEARRLLSSTEARAHLGAAGLELYRGRFELAHAVAALRHAGSPRAAANTAFGAGAEA